MIPHVLDLVAITGIVAMFISVVRLWFVSRGMSERHEKTVAAGDYLFAFLVPALNEALVIGQTLDRLLALPVQHSLVLIVDDGSDDQTARLVASHPDLRVRLLRRKPPLARNGKGSALNAGFLRLLSEVGDWPAEKVIVVIMDADGRLDPHAPDLAAEYFDDDAVGAVQLAVRIDNRADSVLARLQDMEFVTYTDVFQRARDVWGIAGLGGNGQFVRLAAQLDLAPEPWTDGLTEDLEQGLRLICAGWRTRYRGDVAVHQQGLVSARRLLRQRSRWFQGHLQAWRQIGPILRAAPLRAVPHLLHTLLIPVLLLANLILLAVLPVMLAGLVISPAARSSWLSPNVVVDWYWLTFAVAMFLTASVYRVRERGLGPLRVIALGHAFALYSLLWVAAGYWAIGRMIGGRRTWLKTDRLADRPGAAMPPPRAPVAELEPAGEDAR